MNEPATLTYLLKTKYEILIGLGSNSAIRDAEMTLFNIQQVIQEHIEDYSLLAPQEILSNQIDILYHFLNHENS
jgi:hypothetical protein